ncbi:MAG: ParB/RepB/Spo0J family partition protein [Planctomycetes bacterium]|nr:ParB/RepB/Spo0J family partition protein [Planctomycetota bacterium]
MERRLGKGLGSLLGGDAGATAGGQTTAPVESLRPNPFQPRRVFDPESLRELESSIRQHGMLHPITVRRAGGQFEIISGERRWRASRAAGLTQVPISIRDDIDDRAMLELALVENLQRQDLNPLERARGFRTMLTELGLTQEQVADKVGLRRSTVTNHLRLLELPTAVQDALAQDLIQMGHARALLSVANPRAQAALMEEAVREGLSVRQVEARARDRGQVLEQAAGAEVARPAAWTTELARRMSEALGTKVRVTLGTGERTQVTIECYSHAELTRIVDRIAPRKPLA